MKYLILNLLVKGDKVTIISAKDKSFKAVKDKPLDIIFEDSSIIVLNKPSN
jgi:23S rRNA-/tRNA-specific pseudouridylate synthase